MKITIDISKEDIKKMDAIKWDLMYTRGEYDLNNDDEGMDEVQPLIDFMDKLINTVKKELGIDDTMEETCL